MLAVTVLRGEGRTSHCWDPEVCSAFIFSQKNTAVIWGNQRGTEEPALSYFPSWSAEANNSPVVSYSRVRKSPLPDLASSFINEGLRLPCLLLRCCQISSFRFFNVVMAAGWSHCCCCCLQKDFSCLFFQLMTFMLVFFLTLSSHFRSKYVIVSDSDSNHWKENVFSNVFSAAVVINNYGW